MLVALTALVLVLTGTVVAIRELTGASTDIEVVVSCEVVVVSKAT